MLNVLFPVFVMHSKSSKDVFFLKQNVNIFHMQYPGRRTQQKRFIFSFFFLLFPFQLVYLLGLYFSLMTTR